MKAFFAAIITSLFLDFAWIGLLMNGFYRSQLGPLLRMDAAGNMTPILWAAGCVYLLIPLGVILFVLPRCQKTLGPKMIIDSLKWGFIFGVILYGVYDFTNYSVLKDWSLSLLAIDLLWGGILCATTSAVASRFY